MALAPKRALFMVVAFSAGCGSTIKIKMDIDPKEYAKCPNPGSFSVSGSTSGKKDNGDVVSGAGRLVHLDPFTTYSQAVFKAIFDRQKEGKSFNVQGEAGTVSLNAVMLGCRHTVTANAEGKFVFDDVTPGNYVASSYISWRKPGGQWVGSWNIALVGVHGNKHRRPVKLHGLPDSIPPAPTNLYSPPLPSEEPSPE